MNHNLPARPNLDHLRHQAKALMASLRSGDLTSAQTLIEFLPGAKSMSVNAVLSARFRLADAQSALARKYGFETWPGLSRHVEILRALEGTWGFSTLEVGGHSVPPSTFQNSRILIDGDRFRTESPEADYEGEFNIDVEAVPNHLDIHFVAGPEAGNSNHGIFELDGERLTLCLEMSGADRPVAFNSDKSSMTALETLVKVSSARPEGVEGGVAPPAKSPQPFVDECGFQDAQSPTMDWLAGEWAPLEVVLNGKSLPKQFITHGNRSMVGNEVKVTFGGQSMVHAKVRLDESTDPVSVDYLNLGPKNLSLGILKREGDEVTFNMSAPGDDRPSDFTCVEGSNRTLSRWKKK